MHIGLDYDDTVTRDPALWAQVIQLFLAAKHQVSLITIRSPRDPDNPELLTFAKDNKITAYFTNGKQKAPYMVEKGRPVDVWIDDAPVLIPHGTELKGTLVGCIRAHEPVDPDQSIDADIILHDAIALTSEVNHE